jgi:hypothetical protein
MSAITEEEMAFALAMQLKIPYVDLTNFEIPSKVIESIPEEISRKFLCAPISLKNSVLDVAMADPLDLNMMKDLQFITGYNIQPAISTSTRCEVLQTLHPDKSIGEVADELGGRHHGVPPEKDMQEERRSGLEDAKDSFVKWWTDHQECHQEARQRCSHRSSGNQVRVRTGSTGASGFDQAPQMDSAYYYFQNQGPGRNGHR